MKNTILNNNEDQTVLLNASPHIDEPSNADLVNKLNIPTPIVAVADTTGVPPTVADATGAPPTVSNSKQNMNDGLIQIPIEPEKLQKLSIITNQNIIVNILSYMNEIDLLTKNIKDDAKKNKLEQFIPKLEIFKKDFTQMLNDIQNVYGIPENKHVKVNVNAHDSAMDSFLGIQSSILTGLFTTAAVMAAGGKK
jgi:hypothetical protein